MGIAALQFTLAAIVIVAAGTALTRYADALAELTGLGRLLVGSIFLAAATSLPELLVDLNAVWLGLPDLAVGDLMGSSLFNLLILAVIDLWHRSRGHMLSRASAAHALSATMSIVLTVLAAAGILLASRLEEWSVLGVGMTLLPVPIAYGFGVRLVYYDQRFAARERAQPEQIGLIVPKHMSLRRAIIGYGVAAAFILAAAPALASAAGNLAEGTGLGGTFIGTTLVALCTSLPELVATFAAVRIRAFDLALGNIFGSNSFNMALLIPLDWAQTGPLLAAVSPTHALTGLATILITAVAVLGQLYHAEQRIRFIEPDALLVLLLILGALVMIYYLR
jgi:cation:H+ antiporter